MEKIGSYHMRQECSFEFVIVFESWRSASFYRIGARAFWHKRAGVLENGSVAARAGRENVNVPVANIEKRSFSESH